MDRVKALKASSPTLNQRNVSPTTSNQASPQTDTRELVDKGENLRTPLLMGSQRPLDEGASTDVSPDAGPLPITHHSALFPPTEQSSEKKGMIATNPSISSAEAEGVAVHVYSSEARPSQSSSPSTWGYVLDCSSSAVNCVRIVWEKLTENWKPSLVAGVMLAGVSIAATYGSGNGEPPSNYGIAAGVGFGVGYIAPNMIIYFQNR